MLAIGCVPDPEDTSTVNFDRSNLLTIWGNGIIADQEATLLDLRGLRDQLVLFNEAPGESERLELLTFAFELAYERYQEQSHLIPAEGQALRLREQTNTYPTDVAQIQANMQGTYNLELPSMADAQGLPALEYLLFAALDGTGNVPIQTQPEARDYALALAERLVDLHQQTLTALQGNLEAFVANDGNSATASIDRTVNDLVYSYEKFIRAGKVAIPAGVFSDTPLPDRVEAPYSGLSKDYLQRALFGLERTFTDRGLQGYIKALTSGRSGEPLDQAILSQLKTIQGQMRLLNEDFGEQVRTDNRAMLELYDEMQRLTVLLKVDMLQALNINVDYIDADGD